MPGGGSKDELASVGRRGVRSDMCLVCRGELCIVLERNVCSGQGVGNGSIRTYRCGVGAAIRGRRRVHVLWVGRAAPLKQRNAFMLPFFRFPQFPSSLCYCSSSLVRRGLFRCCRRDVGFASRVCVGCSPSSMAVTSRQRYEGKWCAQVCAPKKKFHHHLQSFAGIISPSANVQDFLHRNTSYLGPEQRIQSA